MYVVLWEFQYPGGGDGGRVAMDEGQEGTECPGQFPTQGGRKMERRCRGKCRESGRGPEVGSDRGRGFVVSGAEEAGSREAGVAPKSSGSLSRSALVGLVQSHDTLDLRTPYPRGTP